MSATPAKPGASPYGALVDQLGSEFLNAQEWGLFRGANLNPDPLEVRIIAQLAEARKAGGAGDLAGEQTAFLEAKAAFSEAQRRRPYWYLANNRFGALPILFTGISATAVYLFVFESILAGQRLAIMETAAFWGFTGAILKALYWLQFQLNKGALRPRWLAYFIVAPAIGLLLGAISSLIVKVSFKLANAGAETPLDWRVMALFAAFAGFNWEWALEKFRYSAESVAAKFTDRK